MSTWQDLNYAQRLTLCGSVMPSSVKPFGIDEHAKAPRGHGRT